jgi:hypothetical protein
MLDRKDETAECCRQARFCLQVAERVSIREDRERMIGMAQEWLVLAEEAEAKES